ncbi:MAG: porin, partial [Pseudolabrys sp.]
QYVKICSLYCVGFYYIPGTDTCMKIGGFVRSEWDFYANGSYTPQTALEYNRAANHLISRSRFLVSVDVRSQTAYGTLRGFGRFAWQWTTGDAITGGSGGTVYVDRAFIQLGGWTFGKTESFFQFNLADFGYTNQTQLLYNDTSGSGVPVLAYTASLGNGLTATIAAEDHFENIGPNAAVTVASLAGAPASANLANTGALGQGGTIYPDVVGNLRVDQAWGSAQIAGAFVENHPAYYSAGLGLGSIAHPSNRGSGAVEGGIKINLPMLGVGDSIGVSATYCDGASHYCSNNAATGGGVPGVPTLFTLTKGGVTGYGALYDGFYNNTGTPAQPFGGLELSRTWNVNGGIQHSWNDQWKTSLWATYLKYKAHSSTVDAACALTPIGIGPGVQGPGCLDWSAYQVGSRTLWNPVVNLDVSAEVMYSRVRTALDGTLAGGGATGTVPNTFGDRGTVSGILRFQRNFWP